MALKLDGGREGRVTLINLNPTVNTWFVLRVELPGQTPAREFHLHNRQPTVRISLDEGASPRGVMLVDDGRAVPCELWGEGGRPGALEAASLSGKPYAPLCDGALDLRNPTKGHQTALEAITDVIRKDVPNGERVVSLVRSLFILRYTQKAKSSSTAVALADAENLLPPFQTGGPGDARLAPAENAHVVIPTEFEISVDGGGATRGMLGGRWYAARDVPGVYVSVLEPSWIAPEILSSYRSRTNALDAVELAGLGYLVAFDLSQFDLHYELGTDHPDVGWSAQVSDKVKDSALPGPDGIGTREPLVTLGLVSPADAPLTVAAFTGGFKRLHGAFKTGPLALRNGGSHYGFVEEGVVFSKLQTDLATLYVLANGAVDMKTWAADGDNGDGALLRQIRYARQNGVPLVDGIDSDGIPVPGSLVKQWAAGNWSGSGEARLRSMRAGVGLQEREDGGQYLIYAWFWSATPSAMARVFQAYGCRYAMHLDMNALEHTYLGVYRRKDSNVEVEHLVEGMSVLDVDRKRHFVPRFLGYSDDRDFFYLTRRRSQP